MLLFVRSKCQIGMNRGLQKSSSIVFLKIGIEAVDHDALLFLGGVLWPKGKFRYDCAFRLKVCQSPEPDVGSHW